MTASIVYCILPPNLSWLLAALVAGGYQYALSGPMKLQEFVLNGSDGAGSREGLLNANREGVYSCAGYLVIYLLGVQLGRYILQPRFVVACVV